jgi:beta-galactosidase
MTHWTRRDVLKTSLAAPAVAMASPETSPVLPDPSPTAALPAAPLPGAGRERLLLDFGWRFHFGHANDPAKDFGLGSGVSGNFQKTGGFLAASAPAFDDSDWKPLDLPHDWAVELPFQNDPELSSKGFYPLGRTYPETSVGWYRRIFELPASDAGKRISIEFDGCYRDTLVVFNGFYIGRHSGGYDPFRFDLTDFASPGGRNVLLVRVDATLSDGWFYEGAGIYRHVWLVKTPPVHVRQWGTFVRATVKLGSASIGIRTEVENHGTGAQDVRVISTILDPSGQAAGKASSGPASIAEWQDRTYEQTVEVSHPALWSLERRNLYQVVTELEAGGKIVDRYVTTFGIRTVRFDAAKGFLLNGKTVKLKGTCNHQDHAGVGVALPDAIQRYRVAKLREMGCNAYRTSHNPPTAELLDACDEMGMLVFDETRMMSSNNEGLNQFANLVKRDRNHPSVFMWSMGNEEGQSGTDRGTQILTAMKRVANELDGTRPLSIAPIFTIGKGGLLVGDVVGYNYMDPGAEAYHKAHPSKPVVGTETVSAVGTRGIYVTDASKGFVGSYDPYTTTGRASAEGWWRFCNSRPWLSGGFVWTGFDYRGEPSPYAWPNTGSQYGVIDACGFPKDSFYYYQSWWTDKPVLHLFPHWNWPGLEGQGVAVWVYSNLEKVELLLNGRSLGVKEMPRDSHVAWLVPYSPGTIEARGFKGGKQILVARRETSGDAARLIANADRSQLAADGEDVAAISVAVQDAQGRLAPLAGNDVTFKVSGEGRLIGVGNGDPTSHEPDKGTSRKAFSGLCMALVQSTKSAGTITVEITSPRLESTRVSIVTKQVPLRPQIAVWEWGIPTGNGITGLWRRVRAAGEGDMLEALFGGGGDMVAILKQEGGRVTGTLEGGGGGLFIAANDTPVPLEDGKTDGSRLSFRAGGTAYSGTIDGDEIRLQRTGGPGLPESFSRTAPAPTGKRPAVGPPPDGVDPSTPSFAPNQGARPPLIFRRSRR